MTANRRKRRRKPARGGGSSGAGASKPTLKPLGGAGRPAADRIKPLELWVRATVVLGALGALVFLFLGFESPAPWHRRLYRAGPLLLGLGGALCLATGLVISLRRRPFLQRGRLTAFLLAGGCLLIGGWPMPYPSPYSHRISRLEFAFPLEGEWTVRSGGEDPYWNPLVLEPDRRYGFEFWRTDASGAPDAEATIGGRVLAPCAGTVAHVRALDPLPGPSGDGPLPRAQVVLALVDGTYLFLSGLDPDRVEVFAGDLVEVGTPLGVIGRAPTERDLPCLALHLQDNDRAGDGAGMPLRFHRLLVEGELREDVVPAGGMRPRGIAGWRVQAPEEPEGD